MWQTKKAFEVPIVLLRDRVKGDDVEERASLKLQAELVFLNVVLTHFENRSEIAPTMWI